MIKHPDLRVFGEAVELLGDTVAGAHFFGWEHVHDLTPFVLIRLETDLDDPPGLKIHQPRL